MEQRGVGSADSNGRSGNGNEFHAFALRSAPLPRWEEYDGYETVLPGSADRILTMAEKAQQARIDVDVVPIRAEATALVIATVGVTFMPWLVVAAAIVFALNGMDVAAWIAGAIGALGGGAQIIQATRRPKVVQQIVAPTPDPRQKSGPTPKRPKDRKKR